MTKRSINAGDVVDNLTLIGKETSADRRGRLRNYWHCQCKCGNFITKREDVIFGRKHQSCGCDTSTLQASNAHRIKWKGVGGLGKTFFTACRRNAQKRHIRFEITMMDAWQQYENQNGMCALSNVPIKLGGNTPSGRKETTASLDRIDSAKGYTKDNIQWVHKTINLMKNVLTQLDFIRWCNKVTTHRHEQLP